jgi:hypothetical protein
MFPSHPQTFSKKGVTLNTTEREKRAGIRGVLEGVVVGEGCSEESMQERGGLGSCSEASWGFSG